MGARTCAWAVMTDERDGGGGGNTVKHRALGSSTRPTNVDCTHTPSPKAQYLSGHVRPLEFKCPGLKKGARRGSDCTPPPDLCFNTHQSNLHACPCPFLPSSPDRLLVASPQSSRGPGCPSAVSLRAVTAQSPHQTHECTLVSPKVSAATRILQSPT